MSRALCRSVYVVREADTLYVRAVDATLQVHTLDIHDTQSESQLRTQHSRHRLVNALQISIAYNYDRVRKGR